MTKMSKLTSKKKLLEYDYPYYPPEFKLSLVATKYDDFYSFKRAFFRNFAMLPVMDEVNMSKQLERFVALLKLRHTEPGQFDKADIYALGITFLILYNYMVKNDTSVSLLIHNLFSDMANCNPYERPSWDEILARYKTIKLLMRREQHTPTA